MKKIIILSLCFICLKSINATAAIQYHKSGGGWFGYKYVTTTDFGNGNIIVACANPGLSRCRAAATALVTSNGSVIESESLFLIDKKVTSELKPNKTMGKFIFADTHFVTYNYNIEKDDLLVTIYTIDEAKKLGLLN